MSLEYKISRKPVRPKEGKKRQSLSVSRRQGPGRSRENLAIGMGKSASLNSVVENWMPIFPSRTFRKLRYASYNALSSSGGAVDTHVLRANDLYDPDVTSTGHQPMGFDQMMVFYEHFHVLESKIRCTFRNAASNTPYISIRVDADQTPLTNPDQIVEVGGCVFDTLNPSSAYGGIKTLCLDIDIAKFAGLTRELILASDKYAGNVGASPSEGTYAHIQCWDQGAGNCSVSFEFQMEFLVCFTEPRPLTPSMQEPLQRADSNLIKVKLPPIRPTLLREGRK